MNDSTVASKKIIFQTLFFRKSMAIDDKTGDEKVQYDIINR